MIREEYLEHKKDYEEHRLSDSEFVLLTQRYISASESKTCKDCKHWNVRNNIVRSNECFQFGNGSVMTYKDFVCNKFEDKD